MKGFEVGQDENVHNGGRLAFPWICLCLALLNGAAQYFGERMHGGGQKAVCCQFESATLHLSFCRVCS